MGASAMIATLVAAERLMIRPENREGNTCLTLKFVDRKSVV